MENTEIISLIDDYIKELNFDIRACEDEIKRNNIKIDCLEHTSRAINTIRTKIIKL